jgi:hypothetical protein
MYSFYSSITLALDGVSGQSHPLATLYPWGKDPRYPLDRRLDGSQSRSVHRGYRKNSLASAGDRTSVTGCPVRSETLY